MDLVKAAVRELRANSTVTSFSNLGTSTEWGPWIFQTRPYVSLEGTGKSMVVAAARAGMPANRHNTWRFPRLQIEIYVDLPRDEYLNPTGRTAEGTAEDLFQLIDRVFHRSDGAEITWGGAGGKRIVESVRGSDLDVVEVPGGDGMVRAIVSYEVVW